MECNLSRKTGVQPASKSETYDWIICKLLTVKDMSSMSAMWPSHDIDESRKASNETNATKLPMINAHTFVPSIAPLQKDSKALVSFLEEK